MTRRVFQPAEAVSAGADTQALLVLGIGNPYRRDDAVGVLAARQLAALGFDAREMSGEGSALIHAWEGRMRVVIIDAAHSDSAAAGTVHRLEAGAAGPNNALPKTLFHYSSHQFGLVEAVEMARVLGTLPPHLILFGIEGADFSHGEDLTIAVAAALQEVVDSISAEFS